MHWNKGNTDNRKDMKVIYNKVTACFWEKFQLIDPFS